MTAMARIAKSGLEYFPFDIDFFQDIRIRKLIKRQGGKAITVYALLLCLIYKNGYYMQWDDELPFIGSEISGFDEAYISEVIKTCLSLGLFNKELFDADKVLTSKGIQTRYCNIQRLNKRMSRIDEYALIDVPQPEAQTSKHKKTKHSPQPEATVTPEPEKPTPPVVPTPASTPADSNAGWLVEFFAENHLENLRLLCKNFGLGPDSIDNLRSLANSIIAEWELSNTQHRDYSDWSRHLISSMRIKHRDTANKPINNQPTHAPADYTFDGGFGGADV